MDKAKKSLKEWSVLVLFFAALSLVRIIVQMVTLDLSAIATLPEGVTMEMMKIAQYVFFGLCLVTLIPQIFIGVRGMRIAANPVGGSAHIIWGIILLVFTVMAVLGSATTMLEQGFTTMRLIEVLDCALDLIVILGFVVSAKKVKNLVG